MNKLYQIISMFIIGIIFSLMICQISATEYPTPPKVPTKFNSPEEVQRYLNQLQNYYMIVGRPRFGKRNYKPSMQLPSLDLNLNDLENKYEKPKIDISRIIGLIDLDGDQAISYSELNNFLNKDHEK